jgi:glycosyltransferase involved in cell wall biosynthesis
MLVFILPNFSGGGAERVTLNLLAGLYNANYSVEIIVFNKKGPLLSMVPHNVIVHNLDVMSLRQSIIPLIKKIRQLHPKVIFSTFGYVNVALLAINWLLPKKTKIWIREANMPSASLPNNPMPRVMFVLYWSLYRKTDKLFCTSVKMKNEFILNFSVPESIVELLPNSVDVDLVRALSAPESRLDLNGICYVASGRLTFQKGFDRLIKWIAKLENKKSTLVILGEGSLKDELISEVELLGIHDRVQFLGFCNNPWQWYSGADVFLLPSRWEGMPNVVLESLACGTPVIAMSDSGGIEEIKRESKPGSVTVVESGEQFIKAMNLVLLKKEKRECNSLLPNIYHLNYGLKRILKLLKEIE